MPKKTNEPTPLQAVRSRMEELIADKAAMLSESTAKLEEIRVEMEEATKAAQEAAANADTEAYAAAEQKRQAAQTIYNMHRERLKQLRDQKYISEAESDAIIDSLLAYLNDLEKDFRESITPLVNQLAALHKEYYAEARATEAMIKTWTSNVFPNHRTFGRTMYFNEETGEYTDRSPRPIPVLLSLYEPCGEANAVEDMLLKSVIKNLLDPDYKVPPRIDARYISPAAAHREVN